jgi:hypothetical protein
MPCTSYSPWFDLPNNIWWWVQIVKLPTASVHHTTLSPKTLLENIFHKNDCLLGCCGVWSDRSLPTFRKCWLHHQWVFQGIRVQK